MNSARTTEIKSIQDKKVELEQEINQLNIVKDKIVKDITQSQETVKTIQERYDNMNKELDSFDSLLETLHTDNQELWEYYMRVSKEIALGMEIFSRYLDSINSHVDNQADKLTQLKEEYEKVHQKIVAENEQLLINKNDLDIYRIRLEKKCAELYPEIKIIL